MSTDKRKEYYRKYFQEHKNELREKRRPKRNERLGKVKGIVYSHYGWKCVCCGETCPFFLTIDHVNNDGNKDTWPSGNRIHSTDLYSRIIKENFPKTYQILCMNCNFGKSRNGGICPHEAIE